MTISKGIATSRETSRQEARARKIENYWRNVRGFKHVVVWAEYDPAKRAVEIKSNLINGLPPPASGAVRVR